MKPTLLLRPASLVFLFLWLAGGLVARAQAPVWQAAVAAAGTVAVQATATDGTNIYLAGSFSGTAAFGSTTLTAATAQEVFVAKWLPATNSFAWVVQGNGTGTGSSAATALACNGNFIFVAGNFTNSTWGLGGGPGVINAQAGTSDGFVSLLFDNGTSATTGWTNRLGGAADDYINTLTTSGLAVYAGGSNGANASFTANSNLFNAGGYVVGYQGSSGNLAFQAVPAGGAVLALATNGASVYAAGSFGSNTATFVDGSHTLASAGGDDAFVARLSNNLSYGWAQRAGGTGADYARAVLVRNGYLYVAGSFASASASFGSTTLTNAGTGALFVARLTDTGANGTFAWALQNGGGTSPLTSAYALASYGSSVYVAGTVGGTATFGSTTLTSAGLSDVLVAKVADSGSSAAFVGAQQAGGAGADYAYGLVALRQQLYTVGQVTAPASFGTQAIGTAAGPRPGFLALATDPAPLLNLVAPNTGPVGTTVTLYGTGLSGTTAISFAGASNNVVTSGFTVNAAGTQISGVVVPSGAQSGPVNATTAQGTSNGLVSFTVAPANPAPAWQTAVAAGGAGSISYTQSDASGNIVVTGTFSGSLVLGATTLTSAGGTDVFVAKYNPATSSYVWARQAGSAGDDAPYGLAVQGGSVYVAGVFQGQSAGFGSTTLTTANGNGGFLTKLTDAGSSASFTWAQVFDDGAFVYIEGLAVSGTSVYVSGDHFGAPLQLGSGTLTGNASGDDGFVAKFTDNGAKPDFNWARSMGTASNTSFDTFFGYGLVVRGTTLYLAGYLAGTVNFDNITLTAAGPSDVAVVRLTDAGNAATFTAGLRTGGTGQEFAQGMVGQGDALYLAGLSSSGTWPGTTATNTGAEDAFVLKVTDTGAALTLGWVQMLGGAGTDVAYQVALNGSSVYVAGYFVGSATFGSTTLVSAGSSDGFVARLVDAGSSVSVAWARAAGGLATDECTSLAIKNGNVYVGGSVVPNAAFGSLVVTSPLGVATPVLASISDPAVLATAPAQPATLAASLPLYPNPAHDRTTVPVAFGTTSLRLLDALGHEVRQQPVVAGATEVALDLRGLAAGLYLVQARGAGTASQAQHLVVE